MSTRLLCALSIATQCTLAAGPAAATICNPAVAHYIFVGNTAADTKCNFDTIQPAIEAVVCPYTTIVVTDQHSYSAQALTIANKQLSIVGAQGACVASGLKLCDPNIGCNGPPPAQIVLDGGGAGFDQSVIAISNSDVSLANLEIEGGLAATASGGGVAFSGSGTLTLNNLFVHDNRANFGGGISFVGSGTLTIAASVISNNQAIPLDLQYNTDGFGGGVYASASSPGHVEVVLNGGTNVRYNTANDGAGLEVERDAHLRMTGDPVEIYDNTATHNGGGLRLFAGASADIGSPGIGPNAAIDNNFALNGGGIAVDTFFLDTNSTLLRVFTTDPIRPVSIDSNIASGDVGWGGDANGGALYVTYTGFSFPFVTGAPSSAATTISPTVCLFDFRMRENAATRDGAAIEIDTGKLYINTDPDGLCGSAALPALGAVPCASGTDCNEISGNVNYFDAALEQLGSTLTLGGELAQATRFAMLGNSGTFAIRSHVATTLSDCLVAENQLSNGLIVLDAVQARMDGCTLANNAIGVGPGNMKPVISTDGGSDFVLISSIIDQPGHPSWQDFPNNNVVSFLHPSYLLASDLLTLPNDPTLSTGDPLFVDAANHNYHLQPNSPAVDFAPAGSGITVDFDRQPRTVDLGNTTNLFGPRDLGAYEYQIGGVGDRIFLGVFD